MQKDISKFNNLILKEREEYINTINHNLKIPALAQIRALEILIGENLGILNNDQKEMVRMTLDSCRSMYDMLSDISNTYNYENRKIKLIKEKVDIIKLLKKEFIFINNKYHKKNISVRVNSKEKSVNIFADKERIKQAIKYLSDYCFSAAFENSYIICNLVNSKKKLNISIIFESPHIKSKNLYKVGTNIQLNLIKNIIKAHNGNFEIIDKFPLINMVINLPI